MLNPLSTFPVTLEIFIKGNATLEQATSGKSYRISNSSVSIWSYGTGSLDYATLIIANGAGIKMLNGGILNISVDVTVATFSTAGAVFSFGSKSAVVINRTTVGNFSNSPSSETYVARKDSVINVGDIKGGWLSAAAGVAGGATFANTNIVIGTNDKIFATNESATVMCTINNFKINGTLATQSVFESHIYSMERHGTSGLPSNVMFGGINMAI